MKKPKTEKYRYEYPDPTPLHIPLGARNPPTLQEQVRSMVQVEMSGVMQDSGLESWEEADDFDIEEDEDAEEYISKYYMDEDPMPLETFAEEAKPKPKKVELDDDQQVEKQPAQQQPETEGDGQQEAITQT